MGLALFFFMIFEGIFAIIANSHSGMEVFTIVAIRLNGLIQMDFGNSCQMIPSYAVTRAESVLVVDSAARDTLPSTLDTI